VLEKKPKTLDEALTIVCRLEAYGCAAGDERADDEGRRRGVRAVEAQRKGASSDMSAIEKRLSQLETMVGQQQRSRREPAMAQRQADGASSEAVNLATPSWAQGPWRPVQPEPPVPAGLWTMGCGDPSGSWGRQVAPGYEHQGGKGQGPRTDRRLPRDVCRLCHSHGPWQRDCPNQAMPLLPTRPPGQPPPDQAGLGGLMTSPRPPNERGRVGGVTAPGPSSETYLDLTVAGRKCKCLLDTGCDKQCIPHRLVTRAVLQPTLTELYAANGTKISVLGAMRLKFRVGSLELYADLVVSDSIEEFILSYDWLAESRCQWHFGERVIVINGVTVGLKSRPTRAALRRVYAREDIVVAPDIQANLPAKLTYLSLHTPKSDWLFESRELQPGLVVARSLLSNSDEFAAVRAINLSEKDLVIHKGNCLGCIEAVSPEAIVQLGNVSGIVDAKVPIHNLATGSDYVISSGCAATVDAVDQQANIRHSASGGCDVSLPRQPGSRAQTAGLGVNSSPSPRE
jgi:hypothetical protein